MRKEVFLSEANSLSPSSSSSSKSTGVTLSNLTQKLQGWGGDNVVFSLFMWRCVDGGSIWVLPCSRVGHMFRDEERRPYSVSVDQVVENYHRIAQTWLEVRDGF